MNANNSTTFFFASALRRAAAVAAAGCVGAGAFLGIGVATTLAAQAVAATPAAIGTTATATDVALTEQVVDAAGVLSGSDKAAIEETLKKGIEHSNVKLYMVFVDSIPESDPQSYAAHLREQDPTNNTMVLVTDVTKHNAGLDYGASVSKSTAQDVISAVKKHFTNEDWAGGAQAAADELAGTVSTSSKIWMGGAAVALLGGGAGAFVWSRRNRKNTEARQLNTARSIQPEATSDLMQQPLSVLQTLAAEELHSTDESIRKGEEELTIARTEFGEERTRELQRALTRSQQTLHKAYGMHQRIKGGLVTAEQEQRALLTEIISSCGTADKNLNGKAAEFAELRQQLIHAPETLDTLTQASISLRSRIPGARAIMEDLTTRIDPQLLVSITHNPDIAEAEINQVDHAIEQARALTTKPAGQQGELIDIIDGARMAIRQADSQLQAVENAESQLRVAQDNLSALITEVEEEIAEAHELARSHAPFNKDALAEAVDAAHQALDTARRNQSNDPLGSYSQLLDADGQLDIQLDEARGADNDFRRTLDMVDRTIADANQNLVAVEETIRNRRNIIGVDARSTAHAAREVLEQAKALREQDTKRAYLLAQQASQLTRKASAQAREDIDRFNRRNNYYGGGGGNGLMTGVILGSLLSNSGGFGGGFGGGGGGGFGGGDFGGGGDSFSF
ncbi:TPM domain-containing protein [Corynebacterium sp. zg254]|uniref:TPM domain-containing protein n=1 Tax=Corynebacterium zhongnanshanii TaxID=2768834 RepID=A0ABQ6VDB5_9CORY|nr:MULTISPECIES: TPM domain-containing protein [Corynebacterium]KAB3520894.1 TPM domain-containing protein [Corynebacterium zhongnanshanii]MCR5914523.1 TPM domain-containing protein [Corynebacterium sp. zg254]